MNIYLIHGEDQFRCTESQKEIINKYRQKNYEIRNFVTEQDIESLIGGMMLFATQKLIIIEIQELSNSQQIILQNKYKAIEDLPEGVSIIFRHSQRVGQKETFHKYLTKLANENIEYTAIKPWEIKKITDWLEILIKKENISIQNDALNRLVELYGNKLDFYPTELQKLNLLAGGKTITISIVNSSTSMQENIFLLIDAILEKNKKTILSLFKICANNYTSPLPIISILQSIFRNNLCILSLLEAKKTNQEIAQILKSHPFKIMQDIKKLKKWKAIELFELLKKLNNIEYLVKTGKVYDGILFLEYKLL